MALTLTDRAKETTTTTGTGAVTLLGAATGFQSFATVGNANTTYYCIAGQSGSEWEVGIGTYTLSGTTLSRTTVLSSSNAGLLVNFSAGTKDVFVTYPSGKSVNLDASGNATAFGTPVAFVGTNITGTAAGLTAGTVTTNANLTGGVTSVGNATTVVTNANLTGVITSSGNATSIASQTGTGTKFVVDTSPTLITPDLGTPTALVATNATGTAASLTAGNATALATARNIAGVSFDGTANIAIPIDNLSDVVIDTPVVNQLLGYNGTNWINTNAHSAGAGAGVVLYNATPVISALGTQSNVSVATLASVPVVTAEQTATGTAASNTILFSAFISGPLNRTVIDSGIWDFSNWIGVNSHTGTNTLTRQVYTAIPFVTGTVTITGAGTSRTATASAGTPFATAVIDASATNTTASYLQTPAGLYQITARTSDTVVTIGNVPTTYTNETAVAGTVLKKLFGITTGEITSITPDYGLYEVTTTAASYAITTATGVGILGFFTSSTTHTITVPYNGTEHNTHVNTPLVNVHNELAGLNGGTSNEYYHSTLAEYTGTGTGVFVRDTSPILVTPALGTPTALVGTNITGTATAFTASNVTTNANLTGGVTSVGNAATVVTNANLTGMVTSVGNAASLGSFTSAQLATALTDETGSGANVFATSPTLVTPLLGTPTSGTLTNCTGLPVAGGGTGLTALTANNVILGAGTSNPTFVAPSTSGNYLTSNGTTWVSSTPAASGITTGKAIAMSLIFGL